MFVYVWDTYNEIVDWSDNYNTSSYWLAIFIKQPARKKQSKSRFVKISWHHENISNLFTVQSVKFM